MAVIMPRPDSAPVRRADSQPRQLPNVLTMLARYPALAKALFTFNKHLLLNTSLSDRTKELLILRIGWLRGAEYEWAQHVLSGRAAGLTHEEIEAVAEGPSAAVWKPFDATLLRAVDELHADAFVTDETWEQLSAELDERQLMDLVFTVGAYDMLAMAFNSFGLELDPGLEGFGKLRPA